MDYYTGLLEEIRELIKEGKDGAAREKILAELSLPYVPRDAEKELEELLSSLPVEEKNREIPDSKIAEYLFQDPQHQLIAVDLLSRKNLREELELCGRFLTYDKGNLYAKVFLADALIRQEIGEEIRMSDDTAEYVFIPKYVMIPEESPGFLEGMRVLEDRYLKEPGKLIMARDLLFKETMLKLPLNLEEEEGEYLAQDIIRYIEHAFEADHEGEEYGKSDLSGQL